MMKQASNTFLMWLMVISLQTHIIIAAASKSNGTISLCDGSVEDCQNVDHLDSQLPTISSSHFRRILATAPKISPGALGLNPAINCPQIEKYVSCLPKSSGKRTEQCGDYKRNC